MLLSVYLSINLSVLISVCLSICLSVLLSDYSCAAVLFMTDCYHLSICVTISLACLVTMHALRTAPSHRHDQDLFTVMSHTRAAAAHSNGFYRDEIIPVEGEGYREGYSDVERDIVRDIGRDIVV